MKPALALLLAIVCLIANGQSKDPVFESNADIGNPKMKGSVAYDESAQTYTLKGGGYNIWFNRDEFQFLHKKVEGDFVLTANVQLSGT